MNAPELYALVLEHAETLSSAAGDPKRAVMLCGMIAARIASGPGQNLPGESGQSYARLLNQGYAAAMTIESTGLETQPDRFRLGMQQQ